MRAQHTDGLPALHQQGLVVRQGPERRADPLEAGPARRAYCVPRALRRMGLETVPVPVYSPDAAEILGQKVYRRLADVPGEIDIVDVFRRSRDVAAHLPDLLATRPRAVWLQSGIRDDRTAEALARAGTLVVQDRCLMVDYRGVARSR